MTQAHRFLRALFEDAPPRTWLLLWVASTKASTFIPSERLDAAAERALELDRIGDTYIGCGLRGRDHGEAGRGGADDVVALPGLWADFDVAKPGTARPYFHDRAAIDQLLDALPIRPTIRVDSGSGGRHAWWLFREPWRLVNAEERQKARTLSEGWQQCLKQHAEAMGATLDSTYDLARVLRIPGLTHHGCKAPVVLEVADGPRCNPSDLEAWAIAPTPRRGVVLEDETAIRAGERNHILTSFAGSMRRRGMVAPEIAAALREMNRRRCQPPLPLEQVDGIAASVARYTPADVPWACERCGGSRRSSGHETRASTYRVTVA